VGQHRSASASGLLGLGGFEVLAAEILGGEWQLEVQTAATVVGCVGCGMRAELHGRRTVRVRDLPIGGRPVVLMWHKRIWRCREPACGVRTWTERAAAIGPWAVLTERAHRGREPVGQAGEAGRARLPQLSPTTACGCCCTAASGGRSTEPQDCEAAPHASWRRARMVSARDVIAQALAIEEVQSRHIPAESAVEHPSGGKGTEVPMEELERIQRGGSPDAESENGGSATGHP
jgi:hypothetical protein